jgi:low temperature requirement protein LtrA
MGEQPVTTLELFFDLIFVLAVTQHSHRLLVRRGLSAATSRSLGQTAEVIVPVVCTVSFVPRLLGVLSASDGGYNPLR